MSSPAPAKSDINEMDHVGSKTAEQQIEAEITGDDEEKVCDESGLNPDPSQTKNEGRDPANDPDLKDQDHELEGKPNPENELQVLNNDRAEVQSAQSTLKKQRGEIFSVKPMCKPVSICNGEYNSLFGNMLELDSFFKWSYLCKLLCAEQNFVIDLDEWYKGAVNGEHTPEPHPPAERHVRGDQLLVEQGLLTDPEDLESRGETLYEANRLGLFMHKRAYVAELGKYVTLKGLSLHAPITLHINPSLDEDGRVNRAPWITSVMTMWEIYHALEIGLEQRSGFLVQSQGEGLWPLERVWIVEGEEGNVPVKKRTVPQASGQQDHVAPSGSGLNKGNKVVQRPCVADSQGTYGEDWFENSDPYPLAENKIGNQPQSRSIYNSQRARGNTHGRDYAPLGGNGFGPRRGELRSPAPGISPSRSPRDVPPPSYHGTSVDKTDPRGFDPQGRFTPRDRASQGGGRGREGHFQSGGYQYNKGQSSGNSTALDQAGNLSMSVSQSNQQATITPTVQNLTVSQMPFVPMGYAQPQYMQMPLQLPQVTQPQHHMVGYPPQQHMVGYPPQQKIMGFEPTRIYPCRICNEVHYHPHAQHMPCLCHPL